jgi:hypothetical protein
MGLGEFEALTFSRQSAHRWRLGCHPDSSAAFTSQEDTWYSCLLEAKLTPGPLCGWKDYVIWKSDDFIGNRTRDLPAFSIAPQPSYQRISVFSFHGIIGSGRFCYAPVTIDQNTTLQMMLYSASDFLAPLSSDSYLVKVDISIQLSFSLQYLHFCSLPLTPQLSRAYINSIGDSTLRQSGSIGSPTLVPLLPAAFCLFCSPASCCWHLSAITRTGPQN